MTGSEQASVSAGRLADVGIKPLIRKAYGLGLSLHAAGMTLLPVDHREPVLYFGGARPGGAGGPRVKVARLAERYPERLFSFNLAYLLSNTAYLSGGALRSLSRRVPIVLNQNGVFYSAWYDGDWRGQNRRMSQAHGQAQHVFYQSDFCKRAAERFLAPATGVTEILFNAIDTARFTPAQTRPDNRADTSGRAFRFLVAGKIGAHQAYRVTQVVEALRLLRKRGLEAELLVAGVIDPDIAKSLSGGAGSGAAGSGGASSGATMPGAAGEGVIWQGAYDQHSAPGLYRSCDAFVTLTHQDACPSAVIEAMSCGLPVLHPTSGGTPELVGSCGVALETGENWEAPLIPSVEAVADGMEALMEGHETLAPQARQRAVDHFDWKAWFARHDEVFRQLLESRGSAR
ncbi:MAG: glycosyltransferase family 4 protein [Magnetovibrionaceae bacterium]